MLFVFDTNTLISAILKPSSIPAQALSKAQEKGQLIFSETTKFELLTVVARPKFEKYMSIENRTENVSKILSKVAFGNIDANSTILCKDLSDIKFLILAYNVGADCIISGDNHLKELHPFRSIPILNPRDFLQWLK